MYTGGAGEGGGFQRNSESALQILKWMLTSHLNVNQQAHWLRMQHEPIS